MTQNYFNAFANFYSSVYILLHTHNKGLSYRKSIELLFSDSEKYMARRQLTVTEKTWVVKQMYRLEYPVNVQRLWSREMNNNPPDQKTIRSLMNKFKQTGSVLSIDPPGRPVSVTDETTEEEVSSIFEKEPQTSIRRMSFQLGISRSSIQRVYKSLGYKSYIPRLIHELNEDDFDRRVEYCETFLSLLQKEPDLICRVIWSDEAIFRLNGHVDRHNSVYWATENPNVTVEHTMRAAGLTMWAGICPCKYFLPRNASETRFICVRNATSERV
jgi:hypothetical protein